MKYTIFSQRKTSSSWSFWLLKMPELMPFKAMQMRFLLFPPTLTAEESTKIFLQENILHFVLKCTKHHKYAESQMAACALLGGCQRRP